MTCVSVFATALLTTLPMAIAPQNNGQANASTDNAVVVQQMAAMPLAFTENKGQWDEKVLFRASAGGTTLWFCRDGITYQFTHRVPRAKTADTEPLAAGTAPRAPFDRAERFMPSEAEADSIETVVIRAAFAGSDPEVELAGEKLLEYRCNYFLGNTPGKWQTDVPNYAAVVYRNVYPGVDLRYEGRGGMLTYSLAAGSQAALAPVRFRYESNAMVTETGPGHFQVEAPWGRVFEPLFSSMPGGLLRNADHGAASASTATGTSSVTLVYSTYLGGGGERGWGIAVDSSGNAYVTGSTWSSAFPTVGPFQSTIHGGSEVFVTKLNAVGNSLLYSTYLGGGDYDDGWAIAVDANGSAYVTGETFSQDFPTVGPYQGYPGDVSFMNAFVTKLGVAGDALVYSTYLGGASMDWGCGIAVNASGNAYVTGGTFSSDFPTVNPYQTFRGYADAFVTELSVAGNAPVYSTCIGGNDRDGGGAIALDGNGNAYVTGFTSSSNFPTVNPYQLYQGDVDVFVTKLNAAGDALVYSTYLGDTNYAGPGGNDEGYGIAVDGYGSAYITGGTDSPHFPTGGPDQISPRGVNAFVTKLSSTGSALVYSIYLGGDSTDYGNGIAVDGNGNAYVTGYTASNDFPTVVPCQQSRGGGDAFVVELNAAGNTLVYSTYLGGGGDDESMGVAVDGNGNAYMNGVTTSSDFPTVGPYQTYHPDRDAFVAKLGPPPPCECPEQGDLDSSGFIEVTDVLRVIQIAFVNEEDVQEPSCPGTRGDVNNSGVVDVNDVLYMIKTVFTHGPDPINPCAP